MTDFASPLSMKDFWTVLGSRAVSATIVTTTSDAGPEGLVGLSATHFSGSPALMTVAVGSSTSALGAILKSRVFAVNFLSIEGEDVYGRFGSRDAPSGAARFEGLDWEKLESGAPVFKAVTGVMDCHLDGHFERDGTWLLFGRIVAARRNDQAKPLIHFGGSVHKTL